MRHHRKGGSSHGLKSKGRGRKHHIHSVHSVHSGHGGRGRPGGHYREYQDYPGHKDYGNQSVPGDHKAPEAREDLSKETGHKKKHGRQASGSGHGNFGKGHKTVLKFHKRTKPHGFKTVERDFQGRPDLKAAVNSDNCVLCGKCQRVCPTEAIRVTEETICIDIDRCDGCGHCVERCKKGALYLVEGKKAMMN